MRPIPFGLAMPVNRLLAGGAFQPEQVRVICDAFDGAWDTLVRSGSPFTAAGIAPAAREILAKRIIDEATRGLLEVSTLQDSALAHLQKHPPPAAPARRR
jgi:hypothetical protein